MLSEDADFIKTNIFFSSGSKFLKDVLLLEAGR